MKTPSFIPLPLPAAFCAAFFAALTAIIQPGCRENDRDDPSKPLPPITFQPEENTNLRTFIAAELAAGNKRIVIPPGRYRVQAERGSHLEFSHLTDIEIIADNVELLCTSTVRAVLFENCTNLTLRGLTVDYDPLPFTQGKIIAMAADKSSIDFEIAQGYPDNELREPVQIYNPDTATLRRSDGRWNEEIKPLGNRRYRVTKAAPYRFDPAEDTEKPGDILVAKNFSGPAGSPHAVELMDCKGIRLENITVHASPSFGFLERGCHATTYLRCTVDRRAPAGDPVKRALPRLRSLNADAFHSKDATKGPAILSCTARFMGDDAVNINGRFHYVRSSNGRELRIVIADRHTTIRQGDPVQFLPYSGPRPPDAKVLRLQPDPTPLTEEEKTFIRRLRIDERMRTSLLSGKATHYILTLDREISVPPGSAVCCPLRLGNGFSVKDCDFGENRSRGILIKASDGEVSGNRITNTRMASVLISPEFWWMEAGMSTGVTVKDNIIQGCHQTPIQIHARGGNRETLPAGTLRNLSILNNRITDSPWPLIHVTSTSDLTIHGNILPASPSGSPHPHGGRPPQPILLENCVIAKPKR